VSAGDSAAREAARAAARVAEYERRLLEERARAASFGVASRTEASVATLLRPMTAWGWHLLEDRRWPDTRSANIDLVLVGPGGVLVIDVKSWAEPDIVDGRLYRGQLDAEDELDKLRRQAELITDITGGVGLAPGEVVPAMVFVGQPRTETALGRIKVLDEHSLVPWALRRGRRLSEDQVDGLRDLLERSLPPCDDTAQQLLSVVIPEPVLPLGRHVEPEPEVLFDVTALQDAVLAHAMAAPVEDWMTFLHPEQLRLIRRIGPGPSRIRGAAGTGKTVVALHRAAYLAESLPGPILFTTFVKTLPPVLDGLYRRLSPTTDGRLEFVNLHRWAGDLLRERGHRVRVDVRGADFAFSRAWGRHGKGSALADVGVPWRYWKDEIEHVIKGRGITDFADYASLKRIGRRTRLLPAHREIVWSIYADYEQQLRDAGIVDFNDLLNLALAEVRDKPLDQPYAAVIADEMQDLNCQAARLLAEISGGGERLLLIGDGQQQIYPGGYSLAEAGIAVSGRSTVLRVNYRNAAEILTAAAQVVADDEYDDLEGATESGKREISTVRTGGRVWRSSAATADALRADALAHVRALLADGADLAGIAILCGTNDDVERYVRLLAQAGIPAMPLKKYVGVPVDAVKVGTVQRAKGLEFKHVLHPVTHRDAPKNASEDAVRERRELANRTLFVAMTRARDSIWLGSVA
jgi:hypothetical protein